MTSTVWPWVIFTLCVLSVLALDLGVFHRNAHVVTKEEAVLWGLGWSLVSRPVDSPLGKKCGKILASAIFRHFENTKMKILIAYDGSLCSDAALDDFRRAGLPCEAEAGGALGGRCLFTASSALRGEARQDSF